jgi:putative endonuclease
VTAREQRRTRERRGHTAEWVSALALMLRGYRILARREKTPLGEIDLIAVRGRRIAFVEVKRRATREAAEASITAAQRARVRRAAGLWLARNSAYHDHRIGFDIIFCVGMRWPQHLEDAL